MTRERRFRGELRELGCPLKRVPAGYQICRGGYIVEGDWDALSLDDVAKWITKEESRQERICVGG